MTCIMAELNRNTRLSFLEVVVIAVLAGSLAIWCYWDERALNGAFVYDDRGTINANPVIIQPEKFSYYDIWTHDYWGEHLQAKKSHKSWRPLTSLTFRLNYDYSGLETYWYHLVNVVLNGVVTSLTVLTTYVLFDGAPVPVILSGLFYATHPIHSEAVSNITSRSEILMALFYLVGFLSFAYNLRAWESTTSTLLYCLGVYTVPFIMMILSNLSKEGGVTLLVTCGTYDFSLTGYSTLEIFRSLMQGGNKKINRFFIRSLFAFLLSSALAYFNIWIRGEHPPDFIENQNPAAFAKDRITRVFSINMVHTSYIGTLILPTRLCPDWSGKSLPLIVEPLKDIRVLSIIIWWIVLFSSTSWALLTSSNKDANNSLSSSSMRLRWLWRRAIVVGMLGFMIVPFLLSSNLIFVIGTMKAERLAYFPSFGYILCVSVIFETLNSKLRGPGKVFGFHITLHLLVGVIIGFYIAKTHERNIAWSSGITLWESAYQVNPVSAHTQYNYGIELSVLQRKEEALHMMELSLSNEPEDQATRFVLMVVLRALGRCPEVLEHVEEGFRIMKERLLKRPDDIRHQYIRDESNLMGMRALCSGDPERIGPMLYEAIQKDPSNTFMIERGKELLELAGV